MTQATDYQTLIHASRYARWLDDKERRETWPETVARYVDFWGDKLDADTRQEVYDAIYNMETVPSMRALWSAGQALNNHAVSGYNCAYVAVDHPRVFDEALYILCCGTGLGFSVERQYISKLPDVAEEFHPTDTTIVVGDSKVAWAKAFKQLISMLYSGEIPKWDVSKVRPAGARLKTFGGRASGPQPLIDLFEFTIKVFQGAAGRKLNSIEVHDIMTTIGEIVVVGGVRRSAMISLSNLSDDRMRKAKTGAWYNEHGNRAMANNSAAYTEKPDMTVFQDEMTSLYQSFSGERGIFNREAAQAKSAKYGKRDSGHDFGGNPCLEIILRSAQFCNLSELVVRPGDTLATLKRKARIAAILGTLQSTLTDFRYLRPIWKRNCEEERLLGVSLTGICDHPVMSGQEGQPKLIKWLKALRETVEATNYEWAGRLGINPSAATTCVKPSGTVSQLVDSASGIHPRFSPYYIRRIRQDKKDPLTQFLIDQGVPHEDCVMKPETTVVFDFYHAAPANSLITKSVGTIEQLELARVYSEYWAEHTVSLTAFYTDDSWYDTCSWVWEHWDKMIGMSFLPYDGGNYKQSPYEEIDASQYKEALKAMPKIDWDKLSSYETEDMTQGAKEAACVGGACEI